jgi:CHAT domain-containing protein
MATSLRGLCIVLTLWMVVLRPSAAIHSGTPDSVWWGTKESKELQKRAGQHLRAGDYGAAEADFKECLARVRERRDRVAEARCLSGIAGTRTARFDYGSALQIYLQARDAAAASGDRPDLGAIDINLSALYFQISDDESALRSAEAALAATQGLSHLYYEPQLLLQLGLLHQRKGDQPGAPWLQQGIEAARAEQAGTVEAKIWDLLGEERLADNDLAGAERAYLQAYLLRRLSWPRDLGFSYARLGALKLAQAAQLSDGQNDVAARRTLLADAERLTLRASAAAVTLPSYQWRYQLGRIRLAQGRRRAALDDLAAAADAGQEWLAGVPAALTSLDRASGSLSDVFDGFVAAAASYGADSGEREWIEQSFLAAEVGRAVNPKFSQELAPVWRRRLPTSVWETLDKLRTEETRLLRAGAQKSPASEQLKSRLTEMEANAGLGFLLNQSENFRGRNSLSDIQRGLGASELLLSFALGERESFLWAVTREKLKIYRLAPREQIRAAVREFREAVEDGRAETGTLGRHLYTMLFGQLSSDQGDRPIWLLSLDDELFRLPFAALVPTEVASSRTSKRSGKIVYLAETHSFQVVPGALLLNAARPRVSHRTPTFLGVGDPIYNTADPRWRATQSWFQMSGSTTSGQHNRLPGSGREVESCARAWGSPRDATLLEGADAQVQSFKEDLKVQDQRDQPYSVIHLATHVVMPKGHMDQSELVFSLDRQGRPGSLTSADIGLLHAPGALVVMTGCSTAGGPESGVGLAGLARGWSLAGASAVMATQWPVRDSSGQMLERFYGYFRASTAAEALQKSQIDEILLGAPPASWAAYQVFGDAR